MITDDRLKNRIDRFLRKREKYEEPGLPKGDNVVSEDQKERISSLLQKLEGDITASETPPTHSPEATPSEIDVSKYTVGDIDEKQSTSLIQGDKAPIQQEQTRKIDTEFPESPKQMQTQWPVPTLIGPKHKDTDYLSYRFGLSSLGDEGNGIYGKRELFSQGMTEKWFEAAARDMESSGHLDTDLARWKLASAATISEFMIEPWLTVEGAATFFVGGPILNKFIKKTMLLGKAASGKIAEKAMGSKFWNIIKKVNEFDWFSAIGRGGVPAAQKGVTPDDIGITLKELNEAAVEVSEIVGPIRSKKPTPEPLYNYVEKTKPTSKLAVAEPKRKLEFTRVAPADDFKSTDKEFLRGFLDEDGVFHGSNDPSFGHKEVLNTYTNYSQIKPKAEMLEFMKDHKMVRTSIGKDVTGEEIQYNIEVIGEITEKQLGSIAKTTKGEKVYYDVHKPDGIIKSGEINSSNKLKLMKELGYKKPRLETTKQDVKPNPEASLSKLRESVLVDDSSGGKKTKEGTPYKGDKIERPKGDAVIFEIYDDMIHAQKAFESVGLSEGKLRPSRDPIKKQRYLGKIPTAVTADKIIGSGIRNVDGEVVAPPLQEILGVALKGGSVTIKKVNSSGDVVETITKNVPALKERGGLEDYILANVGRFYEERALAEGAKPGTIIKDMTLEDYDAAISIMKNNPVLEHLNRQLRDWQILNWEHGYGRDIFPMEDAKFLKDKPWYLPFYRDVAQELSLYRKGGEKGFYKVKKLKGSERKIKDPIVSFIQQVMAQDVATMRNDIMKDVAYLADTTEGGGVIGSYVKKNGRPVSYSVKDILPQLHSQLKSLADGKPELNLDVEGFQNTIKNGNLSELMVNIYGQGSRKLDPLETLVFDKGKVKIFKFNDPLVKYAFDSVGPKAAEGLVKLSSWYNKVLRLGATQGSPDFILPNFIRDMFTTVFYAPDSAIRMVFPTIKQPIPDIASALAKMVGGDQLYKDYLVGGIGGIVGADVDQYVKILAMIHSKDGALFNKATEFMKSPLDTIRKVVSATEKYPRFAAYHQRHMTNLKEKGVDIYDIKTRKKTRQFGSAFTKMDDMVDSGMQGRDRPDFMSGGRTVKELNNKFVAFLNAGAIDQYKFFRAHSKDPAKQAMRGSLITAMSIANFNNNKDDPEYYKLSWFLRTMYWPIRISGGPGTGEPSQFIFIPKPFLIGLTYGTAVEVMAATVYRKDPGKMKDLLGAFGTNVIGSLLPTIAYPLMMVYTGQDVFRKVMVESVREKGLQKWRRYTDRTSQTSVALGEFTRDVHEDWPLFPELSPKQTDQLPITTFGGIARSMYSASDAAGRGVNKLGLTKKFSRELNIKRDAPAIRSIWKDQSRIDYKLRGDFYDFAEISRQANNTFNDVKNDSEFKKRDEKEYYDVKQKLNRQRESYKHLNRLVRGDKSEDSPEYNVNLGAIRKAAKSSSETATGNVIEKYKHLKGTNWPAAYNKGINGLIDEYNKISYGDYFPGREKAKWKTADKINVLMEAGVNIYKENMKKYKEWKKNR